MEIDDSALLHASSRYDPAKAREYYLRTRQLKGRRPGSAPDPPASRPSGKQSPSSQRRSSSGSKSPSSNKREETLKQKAALEARLDRLRDVLAQLVDAAKKRSGVETKSAKDKNSPEDKPAEKLTRAEKREKAKDAREAYEPEPTASQEVKQLQGQIQDVLAQIKAAAADAQRQRSSQSNTSNGDSRR